MWWCGKWNAARTCVSKATRCRRELWTQSVHKSPKVYCGWSRLLECEVGSRMLICSSKWFAWLQMQRLDDWLWKDMDVELLYVIIWRSVAYINFEHVLWMRERGEHVHRGMQNGFLHVEMEHWKLTYLMERGWAHECRPSTMSTLNAYSCTGRVDCTAHSVQYGSEQESGPTG